MPRDVRPACKDYEQDLVLYYYTESAPSERERLERHLQSCGACQGFLDDLRLLLPLTLKSDQPPEAFWQSYSREMRGKLAGARSQRFWHRIFPSFFSPWPVPALATALTLLLAVGLTVTWDHWQRPDTPPAQEALLEVLPLAENLEFFTAMDILDSMDLIEDAGIVNGTV
ncbi:MAG: zf-HC2 domain-containing protein [Candidatus Binatia bacterium]